MSEAVAYEALEWMVAEARPDGDGLYWTGTATATEPDRTLYSGSAGIVMALLEAYGHDGDERWAVAAAAGARSLGTTDHSDASLYFGATGAAVALGAVGEKLDDPDSTAKAHQLLDHVRRDFDGERWGDAFELLAGNAGIALGALELGDVDLALLAVSPYLMTIEETDHGVTWENRRGQPARRHHISHGTLGVVLALARTAAATGRDDLLDLALAGAADVIARNEAGPDGFLVPHSDPQQKHDRIERFSYGWCHGPAGDAQVFRALGDLTGDPAWAGLEQRCWDTVRTSGLPHRERPGFWDNNGRCCGTAGVLALACDREVEFGDGLAFAETLVADLAERATRDDLGARWSNIEHRDEQPELEPRQGWAMGNAGLVRELLRHARLSNAGDPSYAIDWPDHPPAQLRA